MRSIIVALALSSASALVAPSAPRASTRLSAATKDPATTSYQPTEGANAAVDTNNKGDAWVSQMQRPRRNRKSAGVRSMEPQVGGRAVDGPREFSDAGQPHAAHFYS